MKRYLLTLSASFLSLVVMAQFEDHKVLLGGTANYSSSSDNIRFSSFGVRPRLAYAVTSSSAAGAYVGYSGSVIDEDSNTTNSSNNVQFGVFYQKYYPLADKIFFNWEVSAGLGRAWNTTKQDGEEVASSKTNDMGARFAPGLTWKAMDRLLLNASIGSVGYSYLNIPNQNSHNFGISFNTPTFGFILLLK